MWKLSEQELPDAHPVLISLGSNINPESNIPAAIELLSTKVGRVMTSSIWESPAVGSSGPNYLNCAVLFQTDLPLEAIKPMIISPIEDQLGRKRTADKYSDRTIDLDVLIYGCQLIDPELWSQAHLAIPSSELMPDYKNIATKETLEETAERLHRGVSIFQRFDLK